MKAKPSEAEKGVENEKNRTQTGHTRQGRAPKTSVDYWKTKVRPRVIRGKETGELYARYFEAEREAWICLDTANQSKGAAKARDYWVRMKAIGLPALLAELAPDKKPTKSGTVGEVIAAASTVATVRPRTLSQYASALRLIAADVAGLDGGNDRFAYKSPVFAAWREKVDAVPLSKLSADAVKEWRASRIGAAANPKERESAEVSANSTIRMARSMFGEALLQTIRKNVELPDFIPCAGISLGKSTSRFKPDVSAEWLFATARTDLEAKAPEVFKALALCLLAGLRRAEADCLTWGQMDLEGGSIRIETTEHFQPKTKDGEREIDLSPQAVEILRTFKAMPDPDPVFVLSGGQAKPSAKYQFYRADCAPHQTWAKLTEWLSAKGVTAEKPIHQLRKQAGAFINAAYGLEAARAFLGHADIGTTSDSYVAKRARHAVTMAAPADEVAAERANQNNFKAIK